MDNTMDTLRSKLGTARKVERSRIWIEGRRLAEIGFAPGSRFDTTWDLATGTLYLTLASNGERKVSGKGDKPIIDITGEQVRNFFGLRFTHVDCNYESGEVTIKGATAVGQVSHVDKQTALAMLGQIVGRVAKVDRDSKANERTDLDQVWETLYAIKADAQAALKALQ